MFHNNGTLYCGCNSGGFRMYPSDDPTQKDGGWHQVTVMSFPDSWGGGKGNPDAVYLRSEDPYLW